MSNDWILTSEDLPEDEGTYLCYVVSTAGENDEEVYYCEILDYIETVPGSEEYRWMIDEPDADDSRVLAWTFLPHPPRIRTKKKEDSMKEAFKKFYSAVNELNKAVMKGIEDVDG